MFSATNRMSDIAQLMQTELDVLVIGGGITGAGIALDASTRGLKVGLVEMQDFSAGTSSRSTKLIHGGLRYLKQFEFRLVAEVGKERETVHRNAPHLTKPEPMLLPIVKGGSFSWFTARLGMTVYEWLAGVKKEERHRVLSKEETLKIEPTLKKEGLLGGILFYEYRTDDARLTIEVLKTAVDNGAIALNYAQATDFVYQGKQIAGVVVKDLIQQRSFQIKAKQVVNAGGPWVDAIDDVEKDHGRHKLSLTKGVHLVVDHHKLPIKQAIYFDTFDKRMIFAIPRDGKTYFGTTDTFYNGNLIEPLITATDRDYLIQCVNDIFPAYTLHAQDIESCWVGVRPLVYKLGKGPSEISRKDEMFISPSGLITIAGGKLTGYRKMAQKVIDYVSFQIKQCVVPCKTENTVIAGGQMAGYDCFSDLLKHAVKQGMAIGLEKKEAKLLGHRYGSNVFTVFDFIKEAINNRMADVPVFLQAECLYAMEYEMCQSLSDFLIRRTGMIFFDMEHAERYQYGINRLMAQKLHWSEQQATCSLHDFRQALERHFSVKTM